MTTSMLKVIAIILMLIDHTGAVIFSEAIILRMIGRLSFPIFAYLIVVGYTKTKSFYKYLTRLSIFAALSQIPFSLAFGEKFTLLSFSDFLSFLVGSPTPHLNVFFTLALGLLTIRIWEKEKSELIRIIIILSLAITANVLHTDYNMYGIAMILAFYIFRDNKIKTVISQIIVYILFDATQVLIYVYKIPDITLEIARFSQSLSLLALFFILMYNNKKGKDLKYFFYAFYPLHLLILGLIRMLN